MGWYGSKIVVAPTGRPISVEDVKRRARIELDDDNENELIESLIDEVSAHVERHCHLRLLRQTVSAKCDSFSDFSRLDDGPVEDGASVSVEYIDVAGVTQTLSSSLYELVQNGVDSSLRLRGPSVWPQVKLGSRITVEYEAGYQTVPYDIKQAIIMRVAELFDRRENSSAETLTDFDLLLTNYRRGY
jgi:uncharacterized phiE125 gp8 family phage protein